MREHRGRSRSRSRGAAQRQRRPLYGKRSRSRSASLHRKRHRASPSPPAHRSQRPVARHADDTRAAAPTRYEALERKVLPAEKTRSVAAARKDGKETLEEGEEGREVAMDAQAEEMEDVDVGEDMLLDDDESRRHREEERLQLEAAERRQRLEAIKSKYHQQQQQQQEQMEVQRDQEQQLLSASQQALEDLDIQDRPLALVKSEEDLVNDEGNQLYVEKMALEEEERAQMAAKFTFDMFSDSPSALERNSVAVGRRAPREALLQGENPHLQSNWDDSEGYYKPTIGERIGDRFQVLGVLGKGVFSTVLKCLDLRSGASEQTVAVKMIRSNDIMRKAAEKERSVLMSIAEKDPSNKRFCVRLLTHLEYRNHVALVFEHQQMNLREALRKFGKDVGINIGAVRIYGRQLMTALRFLAELRVVHADIKLDNILCSEDLKQVKLCDFGSAFRETDTDNDPAPYLVSRFYRAPEIILGLPYDRGIDLWSICVCLYELFTGHVMFPGRTNNEMLRLMMAVKGRFPNRVVRNHVRAYESMSLEPHFDQDYRFRQYEVDSVSGKPVLRLVDVNQPTRDLASILRGSKAGADDLKLVNGLTDLLDKGLQLDPSKRITVAEALKHSFFVSHR